MTRRGGGVDEASSPRGDHGANNAMGFTAARRPLLFLLQQALASGDSRLVDGGHVLLESWLGLFRQSNAHNAVPVAIVRTHT